jgi:hypothetical protein
MLPKLEVFTKAIGGSEVGVVEGIEEFSARLKVPFFCQAETPDQCQVHGFETGSIDRVAADIAKSYAGGAVKAPRLNHVVELRVPDAKIFSLVEFARMGFSPTTVPALAVSPIGTFPLAIE